MKGGTDKEPNKQFLYVVMKVAAYIGKKCFSKHDWHVSQKCFSKPDWYVVIAKQAISLCCNEGGYIYRHKMFFKA